jgi:predicted ATPase/DNA-binding winged helix-turn-helix (wHTH) protein
MTTRYRLDRHEIRVDERALLVDGQEVAIGARAFDLLLALVERADRVVTKHELLDVVWPGLVVEENNLQVQVSALRKVLGAQAIATVPGRGYRLTLPVDDVDGAAPPAAARGAPGNLPPHGPAPIGRDDALSALLAQVGAHPLVTLVGAAGIGKTTLARAATQALRERWSDGVWWVELAPVVDPVQVPVAVAQALGVTLGGSAPAGELLAGVLQSRQMLLVLDNCEHVVDAAATLVSALLEQAPGVRVLATSQELLNIAGERVVRVDPLAVPGDGVPTEDAARFGAVRLFAERARAVDPRFELGPGNVEAVTDICRHLDGVPLAIELAAARVRLLGVQGVREHLGERFRVLTGGARNVMRRHQTLRAAIDWSHALLTPVEQVVLRRLGIFAGGFTLALARQVARDEAIDRTIDEWAVLDALGALVDKSMVVAQGGDAPRYALLECTRAFALEKLADAGETAAVAQRHAHAVLTLFAEVEEARYGDAPQADVADMLARARPELDNLRAAADWALRTGKLELVLELVAASTGVFVASGLGAEAMARLRPLLPVLTSEADPRRVARVLFAAVLVGSDRWGHSDEFTALAERAADACRAQGWWSRLHGSLCVLGVHHLRRGEMALARQRLDEVERLARLDGPPLQRRNQLNLRAILLEYEQRCAEARSVYAEIEALLRPGDEQARYTLRFNIATSYGFEQRWDEALARFESLVADLDRLRRDHGNAVGGAAYAHLALALTELGRLDEARAPLAKALALLRADGKLFRVIPIAARLFAAQGRVADAMRLVGADQALPRMFAPHSPLEVGMRGKTLRLIEAAAPDADLRERWRREGAALDEAALVALCRSAAAG